MSTTHWDSQHEDERLDAMMRDASSPYWEDSDREVDRLVTIICSGIPREDCDEIAQDAKFASRRSIASFRRTCGWTTWLAAIVHNLLRDFLRRRKRQLPTEELVNERHDRASDAAHAEPEAGCIARDDFLEILRRLRRFIETRQNAARDQRIVEKLLEGLTNAEIAETLHIAPQTVANVLFAMRAYLRQRYARGDHGGSGQPPHEPEPPDPTASPEEGD